MKCAAIFVTDANLMTITQQAAIVFMLSNDKLDVVIYCDGFIPPTNDAFLRTATSRNITGKYEIISSSKYDYFEQKTHVSRTMLCKFDAISHAVQEYDRVVYLDSDVLVLSDIAASDLVFDGYPIAAVYDIAEVAGMTDPMFMENVLRNNLSQHYFNSGVIFVDSASWQEQSRRPKYNDFIRWHDTKCGFKSHCVTTDQCAFNMLFLNNWKRLPLSFNMQACAMFCERWTDAAVRHYVGHKKFLPAQPGRNDARDLSAINEARATLGLARIRLATPDLLYQINKLRHSKKNVAIRKAIRTIELLFLLQMPSRHTQCLVPALIDRFDAEAG